MAKPDGEFDPRRSVEELSKFPVPQATTLQTVEKLLQFLKFFFKEGSSGLDDYKCNFY